MKKIFVLMLFATPVLLLMAQTKTSPADTLKASIERGRKVYNSRCLTCHMADGRGVSPLNPPLTVAEYINDKNKMINVVLRGMTDRIPIDDEYYSNNMPSQADLSSQQLADVLTYVRNSFGNNAGQVTLADVNAVRKKKK